MTMMLILFLYVAPAGMFFVNILYENVNNILFEQEKNIQIVR